LAIIASMIGVTFEVIFVARWN